MYKRQVMDSAMLMNISDQQIDDALNDESGERVGKLNKACLLYTSMPMLSIPFGIITTSF